MSDRTKIRVGRPLTELVGDDLLRPFRPRIPAAGRLVDRRGKATAMLLLATAFWGLSFPLAKALTIAQRGLMPHADSWFLAAISLVFRFGAAAAVLALISSRTLRSTTRREASQGLGLGVFGGLGMLLQMDGLSYTQASTSAFLTSCYCVIIPIIVGFQRRRWPPALVIASCAMVIVGMAVLAHVDWHAVRLGRGECETILASGFFAAQIFWLERPAFAGNRTGHATLVQFATIAALSLPVMLARTHAVPDILVAVTGSPAIIGYLLALTALCTLLTFTLMNHWQRFLEATEAGLIYCAEPVSTSIFALFLPAWLAALGGIVYPNEIATAPLLIGGGLITAANICIQLRPRAVTPVR